MNTKKIVLIIAILGFWLGSVNAQSNSQWRSGKQVNNNYDNNWSFGLGINIVDDSGTIGGGITAPSEYWNMGQPLALNAEYYLNNKFSFNAMFTMNKFKEGKNIDDLAHIIKGHEANYFAFDLATKLYLRDWLKTYKFDPYRQSKIFNRLDIDISRATLSNWAMRASEKCDLLIKIIQEEILKSPVVRMDETTVQVLKEPGRSAENKSYMWVSMGYVNGKDPLILYKYFPTRSGDVPKQFLEKELLNEFGTTLKVSHDTTGLKIHGDLSL